MAWAPLPGQTRQSRACWGRQRRAPPRPRQSRACWACQRRGRRLQRQTRQVASHPGPGRRIRLRRPQSPAQTQTRRLERQRHSSPRWRPVFRTRWAVQRRWAVQSRQTGPRRWVAQTRWAAQRHWAVQILHKLKDMEHEALATWHGIRLCTSASTTNYHKVHPATYRSVVQSRCHRSAARMRA